MRIIQVLLLIIFSTNCFGQSTNQFIIKEIIDSSMVSQNKNNFKINGDNFFEDSVYSVSRSCSGEWGGTIKFKNKLTKIEYAASSTCPVIVNKLNGKYYVTNTLAHLSGSTDIVEISDPSLMEVFHLPKPRKINGKLMRYAAENESRSITGIKLLVDSVGILTLVSFPFKDKLYHIIADFNKTYLAKIENNRFITIDTISEKSIFAYDPQVYKTKDHHLIAYFDNNEIKGYVDIYENQVTVIRNR